LQSFWTHTSEELLQTLNTSANGLTQQVAYQKQQQKNQTTISKALDKRPAFTFISI
jgi:hypothetical protein